MFIANTKLSVQKRNAHEKRLFEGLQARGREKQLRKKNAKTENARKCKRLK